MMFLNTGKTLVETECPVSQFFVVQSKEVKRGGVEVVDMHEYACDAIAQFDGSTMNVTGFDPATSHPNGEGFLVVISSNLRFSHPIHSPSEPWESVRIRHSRRPRFHPTIPLPSSL